MEFALHTQETPLETWKELLRRAYGEAAKSPDPSTQNGALVVERRGNGTYEILGRGCNRLPRRIAPTRERLHTPLKYLCIVHAEFSSVFDAMKKSGRGHLSGLTMVCPWAACTGCAKTLIESGITRLVRHKQAHLQSAGNTKWIEEIAVADILLREARVKIIEYDGAVGAPPILHSGKHWNP